MAGVSEQMQKPSTGGDELSIEKNSHPHDLNLTAQILLLSQGPVKVGFGRSPFIAGGPVVWRIGSLYPLGSPPKPYLWRPNLGCLTVDASVPMEIESRRCSKLSFADMATVNLFDLLGDYNSEESVQLIDAQHEKIFSKKLASAATAAVAAFRRRRSS
ncbi:hypothetical protein GW17_00007424 [Ensete ventricosum]|nr:hypothetical protein GW17_00007424 [Ensete ventricosum]